MKKEILRVLIKEAEKKSNSRLQNAVEYGLKGSDVGMKSLGPVSALLSAVNSDTDDPFMLNKMVHSGIMGGAIGSAGGAILGAGIGALKNPKEKNATIQKLAADYIDLKKNKRTGEFGTRKHNFKSDAKRYAPGLAGAGIGGFAANKLTKNKDNKMRNTLLGAASGGTIGELARRMKKANVALKGENEAVITTFSPRRDDEMTEKLKRIIREYENDRG